MAAERATPTAFSCPEEVLGFVRKLSGAGCKVELKYEDKRQDPRMTMPEEADATKRRTVLRAAVVHSRSKTADKGGPAAVPDLSLKKRRVTAAISMRSSITEHIDSCTMNYYGLLVQCDHEYYAQAVEAFAWVGHMVEDVYTQTVEKKSAIPFDLTSLVEKALSDIVVDIRRRIEAGTTSLQYLFDMKSKDRISRTTATHALNNLRVFMLGNSVDDFIGDFDSPEKKAHALDVMFEMVAPSVCEMLLITHNFISDLLTQLFPDPDSAMRCKNTIKSILDARTMVTTFLEFGKNPLSTDTASSPVADGSLDEPSCLWIFNIFAQCLRSDLTRKVLCLCTSDESFSTLLYKLCVSAEATMTPDCVKSSMQELVDKLVDKVKGSFMVEERLMTLYRMKAAYYFLMLHAQKKHLLRQYPDLPFFRQSDEEKKHAFTQRLVSHFGQVAAALIETVSMETRALISASTDFNIAVAGQLEDMPERLGIYAALAGRQKTILLLIERLNRMLKDAEEKERKQNTTLLDQLD
jgi:hypothetical protein